SSRKRRPADEAVRRRFRMAGGRRPDGSDGAGQESPARQAHLDPGARDRRKLCRPRRRSGRSARLFGGKTRRAMTLESWFAPLAILICLLLSAFFAGSETALTASSRAGMLRLEKHGNSRAATVNRLLRARERLIGAL